MTGKTKYTQSSQQQKRIQFFLASFLLLPFLLVCIVESLLKLFIPKKRKSVTGEIVLITGAGHGIGRQTAYEFAKLKCKLVLWDINKHGLEETATECKRLGAKAHTFVVDCSNREDIYSSAKKVKAEVGDVSILVNNAGVVYTSDLFATQDPQIEKTFEVNILAHFWTTKAFLPEMMKNNHGHIVTVASAAGHTGVPFLLAYCSSKFAAVGFHKALTEELSALKRTGVKTTCLCPNFINTGFIKNPSTSLGPTLEPEEVVNKLIDGILTEQKMIFVPSSLNFLSLMEKVLPERFQAILKRKIDIRFDAVIGYKMKGK
ncbi:estradiol 17-beta-dehydrogenase 11 isoform X1 [Bos indicus x Bos taurus]|uniref:Estradiol 17-beta-dehydrogenase 11 n=2 Tax=Bos TaxID=9903 RepID=Q2KIS5_BOVIN|nr:estradiol 17-beta-dehydrogenase 11 [Bos taurus]XP_027400783.1 estradiol 17-beta-dehydrogenase 11 isoform X1 [Bos indicus x Bos taurus]AAI12528.1 Hydroxysteroid (17-beta) dehydrogenase 11 [Bos taurus]DAA28472.1 TPA: estradiol 17-beta-dehydrogenase 11 [Bos taurus]